MKCDVKSYQHISIIVNKNNELISYGINHYETNENGDKIAIHAEIDAIQTALKNKYHSKHISEYSLYVFRLDKVIVYNDKIRITFGESKSCYNCSNEIYNNNLKVYWSGSNIEKKTNGRKEQKDGRIKTYK